MWKENKKIILIAFLTFLIGISIGYFSKGEKTKVVEKEVIKTVEVEKSVDTSIKRGPTVKTVKETRPDGTVVESRTETGPSEIVKNTDTHVKEASTSTETVKEQINPRPNYSLGVQAHYNFDEIIHQEYYKIKPVITSGYRIFGDLWLEASTMIDLSKMSNSTIGLGFRVEF